MIQFDIDTLKHSFEDVRTLLDPECRLHLGEVSRKRIEKCRSYLDARMKNQKAPIYGVTTGFGSLCNVSVDRDQLSQLQKNLVMSHACGVGEEVRPEIVRLMIALKVKSLSYGYSGVRWAHPVIWLLWPICACLCSDSVSSTTRADGIPALNWRNFSDGSR